MQEETYEPEMAASLHSKYEASEQVRRTSTLWDITSEGEEYIERAQQRYERTALPGMPGFIAPGSQMLHRLSILNYLKDSGPSTEDSLPGSQSAVHLQEVVGWSGRAEIVRRAQRKAVVWLRDHEYIASVGSA